jgi:hypothetical protein
MGTSKYSSCPSVHEFGPPSRTIAGEPIDFLLSWPLPYFRYQGFWTQWRLRITASEIRSAVCLSAGRQFADEIALRERAAFQR